MHMTTNFILRNANLAKLMVIILYNDSLKQKRGDLSPELEEFLGKTVCLKEEKEVVEGIRGACELNSVKPHESAMSAPQSCHGS